jgi:hypothetical protein
MERSKKGPGDGPPGPNSHDAVRAYGRRNHLVFKARSEVGGIDLAQIAI